MDQARLSQPDGDRTSPNKRKDRVVHLNDGPHGRRVTVFVLQILQLQIQIHHLLGRFRTLGPFPSQHDLTNNNGVGG